jgi:hypothetical protein
MSSDNKIDPFRDVTVRSKELAEKQKKQPIRDFSEVVEQVDQRKRDNEEEGGEKKDSKKKSPTTLVKSGDSSAPDAPLSLFDLARDSSGGREKRKREEPEMEMVESETDVKNEEVELTVSPKHDTAPNTPHPRYGVELFDLASVSPSPRTDEAQAPMLSSKSLQEIIDQIVKQVYTVKGSSGKNETVIELEGRFKGARLILTEFDSAKQEMNITIDHLKTAGDQQFLNVHRQELVDKLAKDHQIVVHIFTATMIEEPTQLDDRQAREQRQEQRDGSQKQRRDQQEDETQDA